MSPAELQGVGSTDGDTRRDEIIDAFEERWLHGDPPDIVETCRQYALNYVADNRQPPLSDIVLELAIVDLELRWRMGSASEKRNTNWYRKRLAPFGLDEEKLKLLAFNELEVRCRWGDAPHLENLVREQFPGADERERSGIIKQFHDELELRFPIVCNISSETTHRFRTILKTPCTVGRQRSTDAKINEVSYCHRDQMMRMVIADRNENFVSRVQLKIERLSLSDLRITPLSETVPCFLGSRRLAENQGTVITISPRGTVLTFGGFLMHFKRM